jgi:hypothetical protein
MTFFTDLSPCSYFDMASLPPLIAVGWLEAGHEYTVGDPGEQVFMRLKEFQRSSWQPVIFMGGHVCDLCRYNGFYSHTNLFIPGPDATYVAPEGIVHYVGAHGYLPPSEFCHAVIQAPGVDTPEYFEALQALGWPLSVAAPIQLAPGWRRRGGIQSILVARGNAILAAITAYRVLHGSLPLQITDAITLVNDDGLWRYTVEGDHLILEAHCQEEKVFVSRSPASGAWIMTSGPGDIPEFWRRQAGGRSRKVE